MFKLLFRDVYFCFFFYYCYYYYCCCYCNCLVTFWRGSVQLLLDSVNIWRLIVFECELCYLYICRYRVVGNFLVGLKFFSVLADFPQSAKILPGKILTPAHDEL